MGGRTKRIFLSDIHLGDERSMEEAPHAYCWIKKNLSRLEKFLEEQLKSLDVKEVVILGDLFDTWVIPVQANPLSSFDAICANPRNQGVMEKLKALAAHPEIKLAYVPCNHDMAMDAAGISEIKRFMETNFHGIRFLGNSADPMGSYKIGSLVAEHGNLYCLFNAPDAWTDSQTFLPLGYFISRVIAHKVARKGHQEDPRKIFFKFIKNYMDRPDFIEDMFMAIVADAGLAPEDTIVLDGLPGDNNMLTMAAIGKRFCNLPRNWEKTPGNINVTTAIFGDINNLSYVPSLLYFNHLQYDVNIVIFGHTHVPYMLKNQIITDNEPAETRSFTIYANCGAWVDKIKNCTYVETEEDAETKRHYVQIKRYPGKHCEDEGFVEI